MNGGLNTGLIETDAGHDVRGTGRDKSKQVKNKINFAEEFGLC